MAVVKRKIGASAPKKTGRTREDAGPDLELSLPKEPSKPMGQIQDYSMLLFGEKKIGKTTLISKFPDTFFLMTEPGGKALSIYQRPVTTWKEYLAYLKMLERDTQFKTVCVDTIDLLFKLAERAALERLNISHPSEEDWGKGWSAVRDTFTPGIQRLLSLNKGVIFISHAVEREIKKRGGEKYDRIQPTLSGQGRDVVEGMVDIWSYYHYDGKQRMLQIKGDDHVSAGHRLQDDHFRWQGKEVELISMGTSADQAYKNLIDCFDNKYNPNPTAAEPAKAKLGLKKKA